MRLNGETLLAVVLAMGVGPAIATWLLGRLLGWRVAEAQVFLGPRILRLGRVSLGIIPVGSVLRFAEGAQGEPADGHPVHRALMHLFGTLYFAVLAVVLLGTERTWAAMLSAWSQAFWGALSVDEAKVLVAGFLRLPLIEAIGVWAAKAASIALMPLPALPLAQACLELAAWKSDVDRDATPIIAPIMVSGLVVLVAAVQWARAMAAVLMGGGL